MLASFWQLNHGRETDRQTAEKAGWGRSQEGTECQVKGLGFVPGLGNGRGLSGLSGAEGRLEGGSVKEA